MTATYPGGIEWRRLDASVDEVGVVQATDTRRRTAHQTLLPLARHAGAPGEAGPAEM